MGVTAEMKADRLERVKHMTAEGMSASLIAERLGVTKRSVQRYRRESGCARPYAHRMTTEDIATAGRMLEDGCSYEEVGRTLGFHGHSIAYHLPGRGWTHAQHSAWGGWMKKNGRRL